MITWDAPDLSARFIAVDLNRNWQSGTTLSFEMDDAGGDAEAIVYKTSGNWDIVGSFRKGKFEIPSAEKLAVESPRLLLVLVNAHAVGPYSGTSGIAVRIGSQTALPKFTVVEGNIPALKCQATRYTTNPPTTGSGICQDLRISNWFNWTYLAGLVPMTWSGSSFLGHRELGAGRIFLRYLHFRATERRFEIGRQRGVQQEVQERSGKQELGHDRAGLYDH